MQANMSNWTERGIENGEAYHANLSNWTGGKNESGEAPSNFNHNLKRGFAPPYPTHLQSL